ncbi:hypothetical protein AKJ38_02360 [candidate division MSBL1 archaeon SCGC-AAA259I14]|uniref:Uncharacterized protein n=1 Tax=candidate division MSBL1 archaeon SCGC-AAA259I14 TaxID=1698268 RepID=A0A133URP3_9EURY|nr:hypothetical protein AKJ38_02360 [candidate division MSBL1 archaeon SCGC-AAA259I14]
MWTVPSREIVPINEGYDQPCGAGRVSPGKSAPVGGGRRPAGHIKELVGGRTVTSRPDGSVGDENYGTPYGSMILHNGAGFVTDPPVSSRLNRTFG